MAGNTTLLCFTPIAAIMFVPLFAPVAGAGTGDSRFIQSAEIDQAVTEFTGARIGQVGGARLPADPRLRLNACTMPLMTSWHGRPGQTVRVECPDAAGWRIFVSTTPAPAAKPAARVVKRGDSVTVAIRGRGFTIQQSGEAMSNGAIGDWIEVRTARKQEPVRARIERPGLAIIPAS